MLRTMVKNLAVNEEKMIVNPPSWQEIPANAKKTLMVIAAGKLKGHTHNTVGVAMQRDWLDNFLSKNAFPVNTPKLVTQQDWIRKHSEILCRSLSAFQCLCNYPSSLQDFRLRKAIKTCQGASVEILAFFHSTTSQNVFKLVKPRHRKTPLVTI